MKIRLTFILSALVVGSVLLLLLLPFPLRATTTDNASDNFSLVDLLPDIEKIYREALITPHQEAKKAIYDEDIARFYNKLLERTGLVYSDNTN